MMKNLKSINPFDGQLIAEFEQHSDEHLEAALGAAVMVQGPWARRPLDDRIHLVTALASETRKAKRGLAEVITREMGKPIAEAEAEVEKCALACDYYANEARKLLEHVPYKTKAQRSYVAKRPVGLILAIMPWNYPYWQVFRCALPALIAGNALVLKHASNVSQSALALEKLFKTAGFAPGLFSTLILSSDRMERLIADDRIASVSLTGSESAGAKVAATCGAHLKKTVLELGGSDPFIVLADANIERAATVARKARFQNGGQSCIAAKRFIVQREVANEFCERLAAHVSSLRVGDPMTDVDIGPLARSDICEDLNDQVRRAVAAGAKLLAQSENLDWQSEYFFRPALYSVADCNSALMREETFGPVAPILVVKDAKEAIQAANQTRFGLGASLWTADLDRAETLAAEIAAGQVFINAMVASDPALPFGGTKKSGYGRELADLGLHELTNRQTISISPGS